jgi:hypothetical protein
MVTAAIRTIVAQPDAGHVHAQLDVIAGMLALSRSLLGKASLTRAGASLSIGSCASSLGGTSNGCLTRAS